VRVWEREGLGVAKDKPEKASIYQRLGENEPSFKGKGRESNLEEATELGAKGTVYRGHMKKMEKNETSEKDPTKRKRDLSKT